MFPNGFQRRLRSAKTRAQGRRAGARTPLRIVALALLLILLAGRLAPAAADDPVTVAARISDQAFALLDTVNVTHARSSPSPLLGPLGGFAADAQQLATALKSGDRTAAAVSLAALQNDRQAVDRAAGADPAHFDRARWNTVKQELASLNIPPAAESTVPPPTLPAPPASGSDLSVQILSASFDDEGTLHLKGLIKGRNIQSAGIYRGATELGALNVTPDTHEQRVTLDLKIERPAPGTEIRVFDSAGNSAQAAVPARFTAGDYPPESTAPMPAPPNPANGGNPAGAVAPGNVQVSIQQFTVVDPAMREYALKGQISGADLARAGIYVDGRLVRQIPVNAGPGFHVTNFATSFALRGAQAALRVYTRRGGFQETPLALNTDGSGSYGAYPAPYAGAPYAANPYAMPQAAPIAIQITGIQPITANLMGVSGTITGRNVTGAGIYQNGVLVQPLNVGGGILSNLTPGMYRQYPFYARFNPGFGMAVVRAFDAQGEVAQQPIVAGAYNPYGYGGANPYGYGGAAPILPPGPGITNRPLPLGPGITPW